MKTTIKNRVGEIRKSRGVGATDLARRVNVSRQTIYAIEAGNYVPNTEVALHLARELEVSIDELFVLGEDRDKAPDFLAAEVLSPSRVEKGQSVRVCQVGARWISVPVSASPYYMPEADGIIKAAARAGQRSQLVVFGKDDTPAKRLVLCGLRPRRQSPGAYGRESQRNRSHPGRGLKQAGVNLAERGQGANRWISPGRPENGRVQPALPSKGISG